MFKLSATETSTQPIGNPQQLPSVTELLPTTPTPPIASHTHSPDSLLNHSPIHPTAALSPLSIASLSPAFPGFPLTKHACSTPGKCLYSNGTPFSCSTLNALAFKCGVNMASTSGASTCTGTRGETASMSASVTSDGWPIVRQSRRGCGPELRVSEAR